MNYKHFKPVSQYTDAERLRWDIDLLTDNKVENHRRGYRWNYQTAMLTGARRKLDAMKRRLAVLEAKEVPRLLGTTRRESVCYNQIRDAWNARAQVWLGDERGFCNVPLQVKHSREAAIAAVLSRAKAMLEGCEARDAKAAQRFINN